LRLTGAVALGVSAEAESTKVLIDDSGDSDIPGEEGREAGSEEAPDTVLAASSF
jgi:hypothetical protein